MGLRTILLAGLALAPLAGCTKAPEVQPVAPDGRHYLSQPLVKDIYTADPSAHVFDGKLYIYPSHDKPNSIPDDDLGSQYAMDDYRVLRMDNPDGAATIGDVALALKDIPWASKQLWAPDAAYKDGTYFLYFPARDKDGIFRIGVATAANPMGPFKAEPEPIKGSYSMDPAVFTDRDGASYMTFGGIWGGQLQNWETGTFVPGSITDLKADDKPAIAPRIARMAPDMKQFAETPREIQILDEKGRPILGGDHDRRFFEASWIFRRGDTYYFTYSTGDTHFLAYATGDNPYGPYTFRGHLLRPVQGWTSHHSITEWNGKYWLFYHDTQLSDRNNLRNVKMTELRFNPDGSIVQIDPFVRPSAKK